MVEKKSVLSNMPAFLAATGGLITAVVGLLTFMSTPAPSIVAFDASPNIIAPGESSILKWSVSGEGVTVAIEPDIGAVALSGSREVAPDAATNYTLTARNKDQEKAASLQILVREREQGDPAAPAGAAAQSDAPEPADPAAEPVPKQNEIPNPATEAEEPNPVKSGVAPQSDSQQKAVEDPALTAVASLSDPSESASREEQEAMVESTPVREPEAAIETDTISEPAAPVESPPAQFHPAQSGDVYRANATSHKDSDRIAALRPNAAADEGIARPKAVKVVTSADWNPSESLPSRDELGSRAPINAKLRDVRHRPALNRDNPDPVISDSALPGSDAVRQDQAGQDYLGPDTPSPGVSGPDPLSPDLPPPESADQWALSSLPA